MKRVKCIQEIHEIKLPVGTLQHDEYIELARPKLGDKVLLNDGVVSEVIAPWGWRLIIKKKEGTE
jgi:hypothetical protein